MPNPRRHGVVGFALFTSLFDELQYEVAIRLDDSTRLCFHLTCKRYYHLGKGSMFPRPRMTWRAFARAAMLASHLGQIRWGLQIGLDLLDFAEFAPDAALAGHGQAIALLDEVASVPAIIVSPWRSALSQAGAVKAFVEYEARGEECPPWLSAKLSARDRLNGHLTGVARSSNVLALQLMSDDDTRTGDMVTFRRACLRYGNKQLITHLTTQLPALLTDTDFRIDTQFMHPLSRNTNVDVFVYLAARFPSLFVIGEAHFVSAAFYNNVPLLRHLFTVAPTLPRGAVLRRIALDALRGASFEAYEWLAEQGIVWPAEHGGQTLLETVVDNIRRDANIYPYDLPGLVRYMTRRGLSFNLATLFPIAYHADLALFRQMIVAGLQVTDALIDRTLMRRMHDDNSPFDTEMGDIARLLFHVRYEDPASDAALVHDTITAFLICRDTPADVIESLAALIVRNIDPPTAPKFPDPRRIIRLHAGFIAYPMRMVRALALARAGLYSCSINILPSLPADQTSTVSAEALAYMVHCSPSQCPIALVERMLIEKVHDSNYLLLVRSLMRHVYRWSHTAFFRLLVSAVTDDEIRSILDSGSIIINTTYTRFDLPPIVSPDYDAFVRRQSLFAEFPTLFSPSLLSPTLGWY